MADLDIQPLADEQGRPIAGRPVRVRPVLTDEELRQRRLANLSKGWSTAQQGMRKSTIKTRSHIHIKEFLASILDDRRYRATLRRRMFSGEIAPGIEAMIFHYVIGKPKETLDITATVGVTTLSLDKLSDAQLQTMRDLLQGVARETIDVEPTAAEPTPENEP